MRESSEMARENACYRKINRSEYWEVGWGRGALMYEKGCRFKLGNNSTLTRQSFTDRFTCTGVIFFIIFSIELR